MTRPPPIAVLAVLAAVGGMVWVLSRPDAPAQSTRVAAVAHEAAASPGGSAPAPSVAARESAPARAEVDMIARRREVDRKRALIRERLHATAHAEPTRVDDAHPAPEPEPPPQLDKQYIRESVRELIPVIRECYENALSSQPELGGKLVMKFSILGDEEVGGVVDAVEVDAEQSTIADLDMRECMRESMYTLELPAPEAGGIVQVTYPFVFEAG